MDRSHLASVTPKQIFLYPLHRHWRQRLCGIHDHGLFQEVK
jgi:hypothetical protein